MKRKLNTNQRGKQIIAVAGFLILLGSCLISVTSLFTKNMNMKGQSTVVETQERSMQNVVFGDPEQPLGDPQVLNINTSEYFTTIQDAIYDNKTMNGDVLEVNTSIYSENVIVNKSVVIRGVGLGEEQPVLQGGNGIGFQILTNNVTIENINISNTRIGIYSNYSGFSILNNTFWYNNHSIDINYTATFSSNHDYLVYHNRIQGNQFLINTTSYFDGAIILNTALNSQNHTGSITIESFTITENHFMLNDSNACAVFFNDNYIMYLQNSVVCIDEFNFSNNHVYKNNSGNSAVYFTGLFSSFTDVTVSVGDIVLAHNYVLNQTNPAFYVQQYSIENWKGATTGSFGDLKIVNNTILSFVPSDGMQINEINWLNCTDNSSLSAGSCLIQGNTISVFDGYAIVFYLDNVGYDLQKNATIIVGDITMTDNILTAGSGFLLDFYQCGYDLTGDSSCMIDTFQIRNNTITSTEHGIHIQQFSYLGYNMDENATFNLHDVRLEENDITSGSHGIYFSQILLAESLSDAASCSLGNLTVNNNSIDAGGTGILFIENISSFQLGNVMSQDSKTTVCDIEFSFNTISNAERGLFLGPFTFGGENDNLTVSSVLLENNTISQCSVGLKMKNFSISDWCIPLVRNNTIEHCDVGIWLNLSYGNLLYNNYLNNTLNAEDDTENIWNVTKILGTNIIGGAYRGGNFWSDYIGVDGDNDTLGDIFLPYTSAGHIVTGGDYHPLTTLFGNLSLYCPTGLTATVVGVNQINLSWTRGVNATHTRIMQKTGGYPASISDGSVVYNGTGSSCFNASLSEGVRYYFRAWSWNETNNIWSSTNASATGTTWSTPLAPGDFHALTVGVDRINLSWVKGGFAEYTKIQRKTSGYPLDISDGSMVYNGTGSSYSDPDLNVSTTYYYRAWSWNSTSHLWSSTSASDVNLTWGPPIAASGLTAQSIGVDRIRLSWNKGVNATHTRIMQKTGVYPNSISDGTVVYNETGVEVDSPGLSEGVTYYYRAWSWNDSRKLWSPTNSSASNTTWNTPRAPSSFSATTVGVDRIDLTWVKGTYSTNTVILQKTGGYPASVLDGSVVYNGTGSSCFNGSLSEGMTYYFRAWSWNSSSGLWSTMNSTAQNMTWHIPSAPTDFTATTIGSTQINLQWNKGDYAVFTKIQRKVDEYPANRLDGETVYNGTGSACPDTDLTVNTTYCYRAWSWNTTSSAWSTSSASVYNETCPGPLAPNGLTATTIGTNQITLSWTKGFRSTHTAVLQKTGGYPANVLDGSVVYNGTGSSCFNASLSEGMTYYFRAWSWNDSNGLWSTTNASVTNTTWITPHEPAPFTATTNGTSEIVLTWEKGESATQTQVQRKTGSYPTSKSDGTTVYNGTLNRIADSSLSSGISYFYTAWSWNSSTGLWSSGSASDMNTTWRTPLPPNGFSASTIGIHQINLSWIKGSYSTYTVILQKTEKYPLNRTDGTIIYNGTATLCSNVSLTAGMEYYFKAWSWNSSNGLWSLDNASCMNITGPFAPSTFSATASSPTQINLAWTKGNYANYTRIQRKTGNYPINRTDGTTVCNNTNSSFSDIGLSAGIKYYYRAWGWNSTLGVWSVNSASVQETTQSTGGGGGEPPAPPSDNEEPTAEAGGPYNGYVNQSVTVSGSGSSDDSGVVGYRWDWTNDGVWDTNWSIHPTATHVYNVAGNYTVTLQVQDNEELTATDTAVVTIRTSVVQFHQAPVANGGGPYKALTYQTIQFDGSQSYAINSTIMNYTWVFGDGTYGYGMSPLHAYATAGTFTVILTVTDSNTLQTIDTTTSVITPDLNRNNVSDVMEQTIGKTLRESDIYSITIQGSLYYLVDTNRDGIYDVFYNPKTNTKNNLGHEADTILIDLNGDGVWDFVYNPALGAISPYEKIESALDSPWFIGGIIAIICIVLLVVVWLYMTGRI